MKRIPLEGSIKVLHKLLEETMQCKLRRDIRWESECVLFHKIGNKNFTVKEMDSLRKAFPECVGDDKNITMVSFYANRCLSVSGIFDRDIATWYGK